MTKYEFSLQTQIRSKETKFIEFLMKNNICYLTEKENTSVVLSLKKNIKCKLFIIKEDKNEKGEKTSLLNLTQEALIFYLNMNNLPKDSEGNRIMNKEDFAKTMSLIFSYTRLKKNEKNICKDLHKNYIKTLSTNNVKRNRNTKKNNSNLNYSYKKTNKKK